MNNTITTNGSNFNSKLYIHQSLQQTKMEQKCKLKIGSARTSVRAFSVFMVFGHHLIEISHELNLLYPLFILNRMELMIVYIGSITLQNNYLNINN